MKNDSGKSPEHASFLQSARGELATALAAHNTVCDPALLTTALELAWTQHSGQRRASGRPYIEHPLEVAKTIIAMGLDCTTVLASLLHDTVEDSDITIAQIGSTFGAEVARLVEGMTKISQVNADPASQHAPAENIRKILFAMVEDMRVIFIKLADRLHNMRTLEYLDPDRQKRIARETLDVYAPLANRMGIGWIKNELEDLALKYLDREAYYHLKAQVEGKRTARDAYVEKTKTLIREELTRHGLACEVKGRAKHFYSIYAKMKEKGKSFEEVYDLTALRIITEDIPQCYQVLGIIHSYFTPLYHRFKDYIAMPKSNMYSSLHTTVIGPDKKLLEVQIRTREMDIIAEEGAASHILYKESAATPGKTPEHSWIQKLQNWEESLIDPHGYMEQIREDLLQNEIYVFTPKGDVKQLSAGATPVDFAYHIHTDIGNHTIGAKVNGKMVPLKTTLKNCDFVEILTSRNAHPSTAWLKFVKSSRARSKIRNYLKLYLDTDGLFSETEKPGENPMSAAPRTTRTAKDGDDSKKRSQLYLEGEKNLLFEFARCCSPEPGDPIIGYISRGRGIIIHRRSCSNVPRLLEEEGRIVYPLWRKKERLFHGAFGIQVQDDTYILPELLDILSSLNLDVSAARKKPIDHETRRVRIDIELEFSSLEEWRILRRTLANEPRIERTLFAQYHEAGESPG